MPCAGPSGLPCNLWPRPVFHRHNPMKHIVLAFLLALTITPGLSAADKPSGEPHGRKPGEKFGPPAGLLPDKVDGVTEAELRKFKVAMAKCRNEEKIKEAREHLAEIRSRIEFAAADEKKSIRKDLDIAIEDLRKATREAVMKEEPSLSRETIDNIQDAIQERMRKLAQEKIKERKVPATPAPKVDEKTDVK